MHIAVCKSHSPSHAFFIMFYQLYIEAKKKRSIIWKKSESCMCYNKSDLDSLKDIHIKLSITKTEVPFETLCLQNISIQNTKNASSSISFIADPLIILFLCIVG